jgi:phage terminase small subunit
LWDFLRIHQILKWGKLHPETARYRQITAVHRVNDATNQEMTMDFKFSEKERAIKEEVEHFVKTELPED